VDTGVQRGENVRLVQVVGRTDDHGVDVGEREQVLDVGNDVGDAEALRECARLGPIVVAEYGELRAAEPRQLWMVGHLRDGAGANDSDTY
jgi:hypothetical protein